MSDPLRVIMWSVPRSCSSIATKCMDRVPDSQILFQLYTAPFRAGLGEIGPLQSVSPLHRCNILTGPDSYEYSEEIATYLWVKSQQEADYPGKRFIFAKEMAVCVDGKFEYLPRGYRHIFLIRDPVKVFRSLKRNMPDILAARGLKIPRMEGREFELDKQPASVITPGMAFKEADNLYEYLKETQLEPDPIIIDSDDLMNDPAALLPMLFEKLGVRHMYHESMLSWEKGTDVTDKWVVSSKFKDRIRRAPYLKNFRDSTGFLNPEAMAGTTSTSTDDILTADVQRCVSFTMPYYMKLYERRLKI